MSERLVKINIWYVKGSLKEDPIYSRCMEGVPNVCSYSCIKIGTILDKNDIYSK